MQYDIADLDSLENVNHKRGTEAISDIREQHGADLRLVMGKETGPGGIWINFYVRGDVVAAFDYFAGTKSKIGPEEGATIYIHPDYL